jgi:predicted dehydrogenase
VKDIRVALIGGGFMGKAHSLAYDLAASRSHLGYRLIKDTVVDVDPDAAATAALELGWQQSSTDWRATIARDDIDVIDICTPPQFHAEIALAALRAGKDVFCEKPITNDAAEAEQMVEVAEELGRINQVGFNYRASAALKLARSLVEDGTVGDILQLRIQYVMDGGWLGDPGWRRQKSSGGSGALGDIGSHIIDMAQFLVGDIHEVFGDTVSYAPVSGGEHDVDDAGAFLARFAGGALGTFAYSLRAWGQKNRISFELDGTKGAISFDWNHRDELQVLISEDGSRTEGMRRIITSGVHEGMLFDLGGAGSGYLEASANQLTSFLHSVATRTPADPDFATAARVQRVVEAVETSRRTGSWTRVPESSR